MGQIEYTSNTVVFSVRYDGTSGRQLSRTCLLAAPSSVCLVPDLRQTGEFLRQLFVDDDLTDGRECVNSRLIGKIPLYIIEM